MYVKLRERVARAYACSRASKRASSSLKEQAEPPRKRIGIACIDRTEMRERAPAVKRKHKCRHNLVNTNANGTRGHASAYGLRSLACEWMHATELGKGPDMHVAKESVAGDSTASGKTPFVHGSRYVSRDWRTIAKTWRYIVWERIARTFEALTLTCWLCFLVEGLADQQGLVLVDFFSPMPSLMLVTSVLTCSICARAN